MLCSPCVIQYTQLTIGIVMNMACETPPAQHNALVKYVCIALYRDSIPESLLFSVGDLHLNQNMPKVVLSLRAIAEVRKKDRNKQTNKRTNKQRENSIHD